MVITPAESVDGWVVLVAGIHEEATEDDILEKVEKYGQVKNIHLNLDRQTGYAKGYALIEFSESREAEEALKGLRGSAILGKPVRADWAFILPTKKIEK